MGSIFFSVREPRGKRHFCLSSTESGITGNHSDWSSLDHVPMSGPITSREVCITDLVALGEPHGVGETLKKALLWQTKATVVFDCSSKVGPRNLYF